MRRVVVTGMGAITPIGLSVDEFWNSVKENTVGIDNITRFDTTDYKVKLAAEVKDFDAKNYMDFKAAKRMEKFSQYAVAAAYFQVFFHTLSISQSNPSPPQTDSATGQNHSQGLYIPDSAEVLIDIRWDFWYNLFVK